MLDQLPEEKKIILFDGVCNLCNSAVNYIIDRDKKDVFRFVSLQSELGQQIQQHLGLNTNQLDSIILYIPKEAYYLKSSAAIRIMYQFPLFWKLSILFYIIPPFIRDAAYSYIANNRYKWFGKTEQCRIPTPALQQKFLD